MADFVIGVGDTPTHTRMCMQVHTHTETYTLALSCWKNDSVRFII